MTNKDHIERTKRMIETMQAYVDGERIESNLSGECPMPAWQWLSDNTYRIAKTSDSINWDHVAPEFKWMARDKHGGAYLYNGEPKIGDKDSWVGTGWTFISCKCFSSYRKGTVDWKESLVIRPGCE